MAAPKRKEKQEARRLRKHGVPMKEIAARLRVSPGSVHLWTKDIELTDGQRTRILAAAGAKRGRRWAQLNRERRSRYQAIGRAQARLGDAFHEAGCMLYWAEGAKTRGLLHFCNSERPMIEFFWRFLNTFYEVEASRVRVSLNVYLTNGLTLPQIERWWNEALDLPVRCFRQHTTDHYPTSSSGKKRNRLPYGVCAIRYNDTALVQQIFGAIQEYGGFHEPRWLDGPPRKPRKSS